MQPWPGQHTLQDLLKEGESYDKGPSVKDWTKTSSALVQPMHDLITMCYKQELENGQSLLTLRYYIC